jgi:hypothetical protein
MALYFSGDLYVLTAIGCNGMSMGWSVSVSTAHASPLSVAPQT